MKWIAAALALFLVACSSAAIPSIPAIYPAPSSPTWQMVPGSYDEYDVTQGTGRVDLNTGAITVNEASLTLIDHARITNLAATITPTSSRPAVARCATEAGTAMISRPPDAPCWFECQTTTIMGECGDGSTTLDPPEPLLAVNPIAGEIISNTTVVIPPTGPPGSLITVYWTRLTETTYDGFLGATVTDLIERPATAPRAYEYVYSGGSMAEMIYGDAAPDGTISNLIRYRRTGGGQNP